MKRDFIVTFRGDLLEVPVPGFARIEAKLLGRFTEQRIPSTLHVIGGKRLAVPPFDTLAQPQTQLGLGRGPRPLGRPTRHNLLETRLPSTLLQHTRMSHK